MIGPGLEHQRFGHGVIRVGLQEAAEERQLDLLAIKFTGPGVEIDVAQLVPVTASPIPMRPGSDDEQVRDPGILPFGPPIRLQRAEEVLGVVPAADGHHRATDILEMRPNVAGLPKRVVGRMRQKLSPLRHASFQQELIRVGQRPHAQEKIVAVRRLEVEGLGVFMQRVFGPLREVMEEPEVLRQEKRAVVIEVVPHEPIRDRRLGRRGFQRRMRIDHAHRRVEARIRNPEDPHFAVVIGSILHQPIDGVKGVGALVRLLWPLVGIERSHVHILAFRAIAPAHVLRHKDEPVLRERPE